MFWKKKAPIQAQAFDPLHADLPSEASKVDRLFVRANDLAEALRAFEDAARSAEAKPKDEELVSAQKKIAAANKIVMEGRLGYALVSQLIHHTKYWYAWKDKDNFLNLVQFDAEDIASEKNDISTEYGRIEEVKTAFTYHGKHYSCVLRDKGYSSAPGEATKFGEGEFWNGETLVLKVALIDEVSEFSCWRPFDVRAFRPGPWMQDLIEISAQIETRTDAKHKSWLNENVREAARNIDL